MDLFKLCILVVYTMKMCIWFFDGARIILTELWPSEFSHFRQFLALQSMELVLTPLTVFNGCFSNFTATLWTY